jgi:hypothetical protein
MASAGPDGGFSGIRQSVATLNDNRVPPAPGVSCLTDRAGAATPCYYDIALDDVTSGLPAVLDCDSGVPRNCAGAAVTRRSVMSVESGGHPPKPCDASFDLI